MPVPDAVLGTIHKYMLRGRDRDVGAEERRLAERLRRRRPAAPVHDREERERPLQGRRAQLANLRRREGEDLGHEGAGW